MVEIPLTYEKLVESLIRTKYTISDELALLRQKETKLLEFNEYNNFVENCKSIAKTII